MAVCWIITFIRVHNIYAACTANGNECAAIPNTVCDVDQCTCAEGYELETAAGETKDSCKGKITLIINLFQSL